MRVRQLIEDNSATFLNQRRRDRDLDARYAEGDVAARWNPPPSPFLAQQETALEQIQSELLRHRIVGYHCCRLLPAELDDICRRGMRVLSPELVEAKLEVACKGGYLTSEQAQVLRSAARVKGRELLSRGGQTWMVFGRSTLRLDQCGLFRFFGRWGGEALYFEHEETELGRHLSAIGQPAILEVEVPVADLGQPPRLSEHFLQLFLWGHGAVEVDDPDELMPEGHTFADIPPEGVRRVYVEGEPEFEALTQYSTWEER